MADCTEAGLFEISGRVDVREIEAAHKRLCAALQENATLTVNLTGVVEPDLTIVQLIESARRYAAATGKSLALKAPASGELKSLLERGGFLTTEERRGFWLNGESAPR